MTSTKIHAYSFFALTACAGLTGSACAAPGGKHEAPVTVSDSRPPWSEGESPEWPRARFITGVGSADDESSAADRARGEVARVFSADVSVNTSLDQSETSSSQGGKNTGSFSSSVAQQVRTTTQKALEGLDIVARWKDTSSSRYYALAALPKDQALRAVTEKARDIAGEAARYKAELAQAADPFARAKAAARLRALAKAWPGLQADSRVLGGGPLPEDFDTAAARSDAEKALSALDVLVSATGDGAGAVQTAVVSGLNAVGLNARAGAAGGKSDLAAVAFVTVETQNAGDERWKRFRASAAVSLQDGRAGKTFSNFAVTAREDATDAGEARRRALASLAKKTADQVTAAINAFFE